MKGYKVSVSFWVLKPPKLMSLDLKRPMLAISRKWKLAQELTPLTLTTAQMWLIKLLIHLP